MQNRSQQQINLNFQVVPTAQGPLIVQKGVTVQPGTLDSLFAQLKYQSQSRPVSARVRHDSFNSSQSWDGAAHFRSRALRVGANGGDRPGLGKNYNPTRNRGRRNQSRSNSRGRYSRHTQSIGDPNDTFTSQNNNPGHPAINVSNVYDAKNHGNRDPFIKIDATSQTDMNEVAEQCRNRANSSGDDYNVDQGSVSPDGRRKPTTQVHQYTMPQRIRVGAGMIAQDGEFMSNHDIVKQPESEKHDLINSVDRKHVCSEDRRGGAHCEIGQNNNQNSMRDPGVSTIRRTGEATGEKPGETLDGLNASFNKAGPSNDAPEFYKDYSRDRIICVSDEQKMTRGLNMPNTIEESKQIAPTNSDAHHHVESQPSNQNSQDLVKFKSVLNQERKSGTTEGEQPTDALSFNPQQRNTIGQMMGINPSQGYRSGDGMSSGQLSSPPLGTTPAFEPSLKSNAGQYSVNVTQEELKFNSSQRRGKQQTGNVATLNGEIEKDRYGVPSLAQTTRQSQQISNMPPVTLYEAPLSEDEPNRSPQKTSTSNKKAFQESASTSALQNKLQQQNNVNDNDYYANTNHRHDTDDHFYNMDEQMDLFSDQAKPSSAEEGPTDNGFQPDQIIARQQIIEAFSQGQDALSKDQDGDEYQRTTTMNSNLVWQASLDVETARDDLLKVVSEEEASMMGSRETPSVKLPTRKSSNNAEKTSLTVNSTRGSTKKSVTGKKKKKGSLPPKTATASINLLSPSNLPLSTPRSRATGQARMSPSMMKIESVKSPLSGGLRLGSAKKTTTSMLMGGIPKTMVLKSNVGMAAELPKNLPKTLAKKTSKKKATTMSQKSKSNTDKTMTMVTPLKSSIMEDITHTPNNVLTPPDLDLGGTPPVHFFDQNDKQNPITVPQQLSNGGSNQITLVSCQPIKKEPKVQVLASQLSSAEELKIELCKSATMFDHNQFQTEETPFGGPGVGNGLFYNEEDVSPGARSFAFAANKTQEQLQVFNAASRTSAQKGLRRGKDARKKGTIGASRNNESQIMSSNSVRSSKSPTKSVRELQVLEIPPEYDTNSDRVVEYMFGDKAIEIEAPLYQVNIQNKLVYSLTQLSGDEPPPFIKFVENKLGRKVIRIRQKETTGVQNLYQLKLEVRNPETNVSGTYRCRVFVRPGTKLLLKKPLFESPVEYSIKGPANVLQMPVYSAKHDDLDFYLEPMDESAELPSFIKISRDNDGNKVIKLQGNYIYEIGSYSIKLIARDKITRVINDEFSFTVIGTPGIEVKHLPKEYEEEIKVDPAQSCIQLAMPTFNLETVKEEEQLPLEYSLVMRDGEAVPDCIFIKILPDGEHIIELKAAELPPGFNSVFEVQLKVYDPNADAVQLIPISVKCPEPNLMLVLKDTNFPEEIRYCIGSKELLIPVPNYNRNDSEDILEPVLLTLGGKESSIVNRLAQVIPVQSGEQYIRVQTHDQKLKGQYQVKVYATEQGQGLTNQDCTFKLNIQESILTLSETPNVCFLGKPLIYEPKGPPTYVPLPQYAIQRAQIKFSLLCKDTQASLPSFVRLQGEHLIIEGAQNPTVKEYHMKLQAYDPVSESRDELSFVITSNIYEIILDKTLPFQSPIVFNLGDEITLPMPVYQQVPFSGDLTYELEIQGVGMMLAGIELASIVYDDNEDGSRGQPIIRISGGQNSNKGTYQITVVTSEKTLGAVNRDAVFMLEAKPQLKLVTRPEEFDSVTPLKIDQTYKLPVPKFATKNRLRYQIHEKGTDDEQSCPNFIKVKCPKQAQPYIEIKCNPLDLPQKLRYDLEFIASDNQQHNVENVQNFSLEFDLQPQLNLLKFEVESPIRYQVKQGEMFIPMPIYQSYIVDMQQMDISLVSDYNDRIVPFACATQMKDQIVISTDNEGFEGLHDISVVIQIPEFEKPHSSSPIKAVRNSEAKFRIEIVKSGDSSTPSEEHQQRTKTLAGQYAINPVAERSSETLALHDAASEELQQIKRGGYRQPGAAAPQPNEIGDGDRISHIEENEDIPIYYSDETSEKLPMTPRNEAQIVDLGGNPRLTGKAGHRRSRHETKGGSIDSTGNRSEGIQQKFTILAQKPNDAIDIQICSPPSDNHISAHGRHRQVNNRDQHESHFENILIDDEAASLPKEQVEMLLKENEEIRRQIAEVKNHMNMSVAQLQQQQQLQQLQQADNQNAQNQTNENTIGQVHMAAQSEINQSPVRHQNAQLPQTILNHQALLSPDARSANNQLLHQSMQILSGLNNISMQQNAQQQQININPNGISIANIDEALVQEETIFNNQLRQRIEQSKLRQLQQMQELERMRSDVNQGQSSQHQQILNRYLETSNGQGREKDIRLRQLRTQLAQLQEQRATLRKQCTSLKQKEDDLNSDLFMRDSQMKGVVKRNDDDSTRVSTIFSEIDRVIYKNETMRSEVQTLEEQLTEKKEIVTANKAKLRDLNQNQTELESKIQSQKHRANKLRVELEQQKRRQDHEEQFQNFTHKHQRSSIDEHLQTATFSPANVNDSKLMQYQRGGQIRSSLDLSQQQHQQMIPDQIHDVAGNRHSYSGRTSARNSGPGGLTTANAHHSQSEQQFNRTMPYKANNPMSSILNHNTQPLQQINQTGYSPMAPYAMSSNFLQQPQDDMPAAGMPSSRKEPPNAVQQPQQSHSNQQHLQQKQFMAMQKYTQGQIQVPNYKSQAAQWAQNSPAGAGQSRYMSSSEKKVINPPPQKPYRPKEHNIFGTQQASPVQQTMSEQARFQTTYTQFANREKFRGLREGEMGGLRVNNVPADGVIMLDRYCRQSSDLYPNVTPGQPSGISTERRSQRDSNIMPTQAGNNHYERKYRH